MTTRVVAQRAGVALGALLVLAGCAPAQELTLEQTPVEEEITAVEVPPPPLMFRAPSNCSTLLLAEQSDELAAEGIELLRGPGSPGNEPVYVNGQSPEEAAGGISCLFGLPADEDESISIVLSVAPVASADRGDIIADLLAQNLNVGQTSDGKGLTYWIWGDETVVSALHNELYEDSWYSALVQPGGRPAYDQAVSLVASMRQATTS